VRNVTCSRVITQRARATHSRTRATRDQRPRRGLRHENHVVARERVSASTQPAPRARILPGARLELARCPIRAHNYTAEGPRVVVQGLGEATAWNIQVSLKFLLVVNIVMLSAAVVTPSLSASGSSARLSSLFPPTCLFSLSLAVCLFPFCFLSYSLQPVLFRPSRPELALCLPVLA